ncbi:hypothetical protein Fcan01_18125 [Folsomia candida]|uniref:Uncharacterized protein n=1 Tax=Folsomia candida TaxID=158441 RepID=A0A226DNJ2_FOLCA|nr:hypothetical protein Fcan01_18125 [Folsomia candida]
MNKEKYIIVVVYVVHGKCIVVIFQSAMQSILNLGINAATGIRTVARGFYMAYPKPYQRATTEEEGFYKADPKPETIFCFHDNDIIQNFPSTLEKYDSLSRRLDPVGVFLNATVAFFTLCPFFMAPLALYFEFDAASLFCKYVLPLEHDTIWGCTFRYLIRLPAGLSSSSDNITAILMGVGLVLCVAFNFISIRMYGSIPFPLYLYFPSVAIIIPLIIDTMLPMAIRVYEETSKIRRNWEYHLNGTENRKYISRRLQAVRPLQVKCRIMGYQGLKLTKSTKVGFYSQILEHTMTALLSIPHVGRGKS